jgi:hypothetical protein
MGSVAIRQTLRLIVSDNNKDNNKKKKKVRLLEKEKRGWDDENWAMP